MAGRRTLLGGLTLERKLPLLINALIALTFVVTLVVASRELRESARVAMHERLERAAGQLAELSGTLMRARLDLLRTAATDAAVRRLLEGDTAAAADAALALARINRGEEASPVRLVGADGRILLQVPAEVRPAHASPPEGVPSIHDLFPGADGRAAYWVSMPVTGAAGATGAIEQLRSLGSRALGEQMEGLLGGGIEIVFGRPAGGARASLDGELLTDGALVPRTSRAFVYRSARGVPVHAYAAPIVDTHWVVIAEVPVSVVNARADRVTRRVLLLGAMLLLLGVLAARLVSRSVTRPIGRLAAAADAIARGDYRSRVRLERTDEIGRLASSFDAMVDQVEASHAELARRMGEAQALAHQLENANGRLHAAIADAEAARAEAQQANRAKSDFLATISHEIRTPINAMIGYTDLLEHGVAGELLPQQRAWLERIHVSGQHLIALVNDVLDFAKIESGQLRVERTIAPARVSIDAALAMFDGRVAARGLRLSVDCAIETVYLGDAQRVQQILLNLLSNAVKFTEPGGWVTVSCDRRCSISHPRSGAEDDVAEWTCITVADSGVGIAADQLQSIFEPFVQGSGGYTRVHAGTGLGLAISRSLARMMSGDLTVHSELGAGASFTLWLPHPAGVRAAAAASRA